jgi:hypothetical protein
MRRIVLSNRILNDQLKIEAKDYRTENGIDIDEYNFLRLSGVEHSAFDQLLNHTIGHYVIFAAGETFYITDFSWPPYSHENILNYRSDFPGIVFDRAYSGGLSGLLLNPSTIVNDGVLLSASGSTGPVGFWDPPGPVGDPGPPGPTVRPGPPVETDGVVGISRSPSPNGNAEPGTPRVVLPPRTTREEEGMESSSGPPGVTGSHGEGVSGVIPPPRTTREEVLRGLESGCGHPGVPGTPGEGVSGEIPVSTTYLTHSSEGPIPVTVSSYVTPNFVGNSSDPTPYGGMSSSGATAEEYYDDDYDIDGQYEIIDSLEDSQSYPVELIGEVKNIMPSKEDSSFLATRDAEALLDLVKEFRFSFTKRLKDLEKLAETLKAGVHSALYETFWKEEDVVDFCKALPIESIKFYDNSIIIRTRTIDCPINKDLLEVPTIKEMGITEATFHLGKFDIYIGKDFECKITGVAGIQHPHQYGSLCWGDAYEDYRKAIEGKDYLTLISLIVNLANNVNLRDEESVSKLKYFPWTVRINNELFEHAVYRERDYITLHPITGQPMKYSFVYELQRTN